MDQRQTERSEGDAAVRRGGGGGDSKLTAAPIEAQYKYNSVEAWRGSDGS